MEIVFDYPPNIDQLRKHFTLKESVVFTYGNKLYNPGHGNIDEHLMKHEETHSRQQLSHLTPAEWWDRYLRDPEFRLSQEVEAYQNQYQSFSAVNNRQVRRRFLRDKARDLSGAIYGKIVSHQQAMDLIKNG